MLDRYCCLLDLDQPSLPQFGTLPQARPRSGLAWRFSSGTRPRAVVFALAAMLSFAPDCRAAGQAVQEDVPDPVILVHPADGATVPVSRGNGIALAWRPHRADDVWYFVEVVELVSNERRDVFTGYTRQTALRVRLDEAGQYMWRVLAVNRVSAHYSVSPWSSFTISGDAR